MAFKRKVTRKQFLKQPDEFITTAQRIMNFVQQNTRLLYSILVITTGLLIMGGIGWLYLTDLKQKARALEDKALELYHRPVLGAETPKTPAAVGFSNEEERYHAALPQFQQLVDEYGWTKSAQRALLYIGDCYYGLGEYDKAKQVYEKYLAEYPDDKLMGYLLWQSLGYTCEAQDKLDEAIGYYRQALNQEAPAAKFQLYLDIARCYELKQDWQQALATYKEAVSTFAENPRTDEIRQRIQELEAVISSANLPQSSS
jgi:tetratricopeptide (TPR) repeat protein